LQIHPNLLNIIIPMIITYVWQLEIASVGAALMISVIGMIQDLYTPIVTTQKQITVGIAILPILIIVIATIIFTGVIFSISGAMVGKTGTMDFM
jgi:hypothetical protein